MTRDSQIAAVIKLVVPADRARCTSFVVSALNDIDLAKRDHQHEDDLASKSAKKALRAHRAALNRARATHAGLPDGLKQTLEASAKTFAREQIDFSASIDVCDRILELHRRRVIDFPRIKAAAWAKNTDAGHSLDAELDARWLEREDLMRGDLILREQLDHARAKLPDWANTGYSELDSEGNKCGLETGWPEIANLPETSGGPGVIATIRPSPYDYKKRLRIEADVFGRETAVARYKSRMRAFIARRREQTRLMADLGITEAERQLEQRADRQWDIGSAIMDLPPSINQALAAAIIDAGQETTTGCTANDPTKPFVGVFRLAQALRSQATGAVRASIDRIFDNPDETLEDLAILPF